LCLLPTSFSLISKSSHRVSFPFSSHLILLVRSVFAPPQHQPEEPGPGHADPRPRRQGLLRVPRRDDLHDLHHGQLPGRPARSLLPLYPLLLRILCAVLAPASRHCDHSMCICFAPSSHLLCHAPHAHLSGQVRGDVRGHRRVAVPLRGLQLPGRPRAGLPHGLHHDVQLRQLARLLQVRPVAHATAPSPLFRTLFCVLRQSLLSLSPCHTPHR
jgi:hypothetical protein